MRFFNKIKGTLAEKDLRDKLMKKRFCESCGTAMTISRFYRNYCRQSGKPKIYELHIKCPKYSKESCRRYNPHNFNFIQCDHIGGKEIIQICNEIDFPIRDDIVEKLLETK